MTHATNIYYIDNRLMVYYHVNKLTNAMNVLCAQKICSYETINEAVRSVSKSKSGQEDLYKRGSVTHDLKDDGLELYCLTPARADNWVRFDTLNVVQRRFPYSLTRRSTERTLLK